MEAGGGHGGDARRVCVSRQQAFAAFGPEPDREYAQWFTPPATSSTLVSMVAADLRHPGAQVVEPSAGAGSLVRAVRTLAPHAHITACEIDPRWADALRCIADEVRLGDYLAQDSPPTVYDVGVSNPPFDGGQEGAHIAKLLSEVSAAALLLPTRSMHGRERYDLIWHQFDPRVGWPTWAITKRRYMVARPRFAKSGGSDEIVMLRCDRVPAIDDLAGDPVAMAKWKEITEATGWD